MNPPPIRAFRADDLAVKVYADRDAMGRAAAAGAAAILADRQRAGGLARAIFAAAPSQNELLAALSADRSVDWARVLAFHMDEYLGLGPDHPAAFRRYLAHHLFDPAGIPVDHRRPIPGESADRPLRVCLDYEEALRAGPIDLVCAGIGENGHLAFNDPPVADFLDPVWMKVVRLDADCRRQQVNDGAFAAIDSVPAHAYTLTIPALLSAASLVVVVPGPRKAAAVRAALLGPIAESCPASALRRHPGATLYLDRDAAASLS